MSEAWQELHERYQHTIADTIADTFRRVGMSLNSDGSEDNELQVKGLEDVVIRDYNHEDEPPADVENEVVALESEDSDTEIDTPAPGARSRRPRDKNWKHFQTQPFQDFQPEILERRRTEDEKGLGGDCYFTAEKAESPTTVVSEDEDEVATGSDRDMTAGVDVDSHRLAVTKS